MPGSYTPTQAFQHELNVMQGWPFPEPLQKSKQVKLGEFLRKGRVCSIDAVADQWVLGCAAGKQPFFAFSGKEVGDWSSLGDVGTFVAEVCNALPHKGPYEFESTEYLGVAFPPDTALASEQGAGVNADGSPEKGMVRAAVGGLAGVEDIVGMVSDLSPISNFNGYQISAIRYLPYWLPIR